MTAVRPALAGVIFDLDGVITDTAEFHFIAWQQLAEQLGIHFSRPDNEALKGVDRLGSLRLILQKGRQHLSAEQELYWCNWKNERYLQLLEAMTPADVFAGVPTLLADLRSLGIRLGLASASRNAALVLQKLQLSHAFDVIADPAMVPGKPAPDLFLSACQAMALLPEQCVGVEDAPAGISAVKAAKMLAIGIGQPSQLLHADVVIPQTGLITAQFLAQCWQYAKTG